MRQFKLSPRQAAITVAVLGAVLLGACNQVGQYPPEARTNFVNGCTQGGGQPAVCECGFRNIQKEFSYAQFVEMDRAAATGQQHASMPRLQAIMMTCMGNPNT